MKKSYVEVLQKGIFRKIYLIAERCASIIPDSIYLRIIYRIRMGKKLNLKNPVTFNEKLQWLKIHNRKSVYTDMVDKYAVKNIVADKIGKEYVIPTLGVWDRFEDINFDELPEKFVLKCTHDSGSVLICKDKSKINYKKEKKKFKSALKRNYYWSGREWPYKNVHRRIIAEPYLDFLGKQDSVEYKITCFNGKLAFSTICTGKAHSKLNERKNDFYDRDFNLLPFWSFYKHSENPIKEKPEILYKMEDFAELFAKDIPYLRVDFYADGDKIYFGELTFFTWGGFNKFEPKEWDKKLGDKLKIQLKKGIK